MSFDENTSFFNTLRLIVFLILILYPKSPIAKLLLAEFGVSRIEGEKIYKYYFREFVYYLKMTLMIGVTAIVIYYLYYDGRINYNFNYMAGIEFMFLPIMFVASFITMCYKFILFLLYKKRCK